ncbi:MAG TPA: hypothetical protein VF145_11980, partial [Chitinophagaceae bacterium]
EEADPDTWDKLNDFANVIVDLPDGRHYGINIWTFQYMAATIRRGLKAEESSDALYFTPPDLLVRELTRACISQTISELLEKGDLEDLLNPGVLGKSQNP